MYVNTISIPCQATNTLRILPITSQHRTLLIIVHNIAADHMRVVQHAERLIQLSQPHDLVRKNSTASSESRPLPTMLPLSVMRARDGVPELRLDVRVGRDPNQHYGAHRPDVTGRMRERLLLARHYEGRVRPESVWRGLPQILDHARQIVSSRSHRMCNV